MSKKSDADQDAKVMKNMTPAQMIAFKKADKKIDKALAKKIQKK